MNKINKLNLKKKYNFNDLIDLMDILRDPKDGCAWDLEQDFKTISNHTIEEAYEVADAIYKKDYKNLQDEVGDLLFQVIYHSKLAKENNFFDINDVINSIVKKMIRRHPHIFKSKEKISSSEQEKRWELIKEKEKKLIGENEKNISSMIPSSLPPINKSQKLQNFAQKKGFDWPDIDGVFRKLYEEIKELEYELKNRNKLINKQFLEDELGDVLFTLIRLIQKLNLDTNNILNQSNNKFEKRFQLMEKIINESGNSIEKLKIELWSEHFVPSKGGVPAKYDVSSGIFVYQ